MSTALRLAPDDLTLDAAMAMIERYAPDRMAEAHAQFMKDKSYQRYPLGQEAAVYLRIKRKRLTPASERAWEGCLDKLARDLWTLKLSDLEPPAGTDHLERFLEERWGDAEPRTYNKNLTIVRDFIRWAIMRGELHGDPTLPIQRAKTRQVYRTTFTPDQRHAIIAQAELLRDRIALRLLLDYGLRQGALRAIQFKHFDHQRKRLTIFTKGGNVRELPIPQAAFWFDLERHILDSEARPHHFLMHSATGNQYARREDPTRPMSNRAAHYWWYQRLEDAGIVPKGTTRGERMHKARHTAGQRLLDATEGNLKAVQKLLGHASIQTTGDVYADWDIEALAHSMEQVFEADDGD